MTSEQKMALAVAVMRWLRANPPAVDCLDKIREHTGCALHTLVDSDEIGQFSAIPYVALGVVLRALRQGSAVDPRSLLAAAIAGACEGAANALLASAGTLEGLEMLQKDYSATIDNA